MIFPTLFRVAGERWQQWRTRGLALAGAVILAACSTVPTEPPSNTTQLRPATPYAGLPTRAPATFPTVDLVAPVDDVWERIRHGFAIPDLNTPEVEAWTRFYAERPEMMQQLAERASLYLYYVVDETKRRHLPTELALVPFIESGWNPVALSRSKASGLWQFIPSTGKHFNLRQDEWLDERRDPIASTQAALDYLNYLFDFQGDWYLALASYNWGEGAVQRAMRKNEDQGLPTDYLALTMPEETRNYVPKLQAIKNIIRDPASHGVVLPPVVNQPYFVVVPKQQDIDIEVAAQLAGMQVEDLQLLNPGLKRGVISERTGRRVVLPVTLVDTFLANLEAHEGPLVRARPASPARAAVAVAGNRNAQRVYRVRSGDTLYTIARRYKTTVANLRNINQLPSTRLKVGQRLRVPGAG